MNNVSILYGYKHISPRMLFTFSVPKEQPKTNSRLMYLLELLVGKAAIVGFKVTFSLNMKQYYKNEIAY